jgi:hypothetical protein
MMVNAEKRTARSSEARLCYCHSINRHTYSLHFAFELLNIIDSTFHSSMTLQSSIYSHASIFKTLSQRYPTLQFTFLYGSAKLNNVSSTSDIDCIAIIEGETPPRREHFIGLGKIFDVYVFNPESLHAAMRQSYLVGEPMLVESVLSSTVLPSSTFVSTRLVDIALKLQAIPLLPPKALMLSIRESLASLLDDLSGEINESEHTMRMVELFTIISKTRLLMLGKGKQSFRYTARLLHTENPDAAAVLDSAFKEALAQNPKQLVELGRKLLDDMGGALPDERKYMLKDYPRLPLGN